jgi:hypothetical protein
MWMVIIAFIVNNQPVAIFEEQAKYETEVLCQMHVEAAVADLKEYLAKDAVPVLTPLLEKGQFEGKCAQDPDKPKPKEHKSGVSSVPAGYLSAWAGPLRPFLAP